MKIKAEKKQKKEKKKRKISVGRAFENDLFALKLMAKTAPIFTFTYFGWSIFRAVKVRRWRSRACLHVLMSL